MRKKNTKKKVHVWIPKLKKGGYLLASQNNFFGELCFYIKVGRETMVFKLEEFKLL